MKHISACSQMQNTKSLLGSKDFCKLAYTLFIERHASPPQRSQSKWISDFQIYDVDVSRTVCLFFAPVNPNYESSSLNYFIVEFPQIDISLKLESHQASCALFVKTHGKPFSISFGNVRKSKSSGTKLKHGCAIIPASQKENFSLQSCLGFVDDSTDLLFHHALLISRYHIFWAKCMHHRPTRELFIRNFLTCLEVERRFSLKNGFLTKFNKKWGAFLAEEEK